VPQPKYSLVINRCPRHGEFWCVSLDNDTGGQRLTRGKCCGSWSTVKGWPLSVVELRELATTLDAAAIEAEKAGAQ
jgi:hypothetical protein